MLYHTTKNLRERNNIYHLSKSFAFIFGKSFCVSLETSLGNTDFKSLLFSFFPCLRLQNSKSFNTIRNLKVLIFNNYPNHVEMNFSCPFQIDWECFKIVSWTLSNKLINHTRQWQNFFLFQSGVIFSLTHISHQTLYLIYLNHVTSSKFTLLGITPE